MYTNLTTEDGSHDHSLLAVMPIFGEFNYRNEAYYYTITSVKNKDVFTLQIFKELCDVIWEKEFNFESLVKESMKWGILEDNEMVIVFLCEKLKDPASLSFTNKTLTLKFPIEFNKINKEVEFVLKTEEVDMKKAYASVSHNLKSVLKKVNTLDEKFQRFTGEHESCDRINEKLKEVGEDFNEVKSKLSNLVSDLIEVNSKAESCYKELKEEVEILRTNLRIEFFYKEHLLKQFEELEKKMALNNASLSEKIATLEGKLSSKVESDKIGGLIMETSKCNEQIQDLSNNVAQKTADIEEAGKKINLLSEEANSNKAQIEKLEFEVAELKSVRKVASSIVKVDTSFMTYDNNFTTSNNGKTIERNNLSNNSWCGAICDTKIPFDGLTYEFSIKVDGTYGNVDYDGHFMLGFASSSANKAPAYHNINSTWLVHLANKNIYQNGNASILFLLNYEALRVRRGDILSIFLDTAKCEVYFKYNGMISSFKRKINIDNSLKDKIFPCIDLYGTGQKVTIV